jgi:predicted flavoprotein YhiN
MTRFRAKDKRPVPDSDDLTLAAGRRVAVIGAGPAGLMAAEMLARAGATVTVYDRMASPGRKFLMAGRGGLNLTHSEDLTAFVGRYGETHPLLRGAIEAFPPAALRA